MCLSVHCEAMQEQESKDQQRKGPEFFLEVNHPITTSSIWLVYDCYYFGTSESDVSEAPVTCRHHQSNRTNQQQLDWAKGKGMGRFMEC